jgi:hypothetical protein
MENHYFKQEKRMLELMLGEELPEIEPRVKDREE